MYQNKLDSNISVVSSNDVSEDLARKKLAGWDEFYLVQIDINSFT